MSPAPRRFRVCARPFFDVGHLRYGRCDRRANHDGECNGPLAVAGSTEARELRAEHMRLARTEDGARP